MNCSDSVVFFVLILVLLQILIGLVWFMVLNSTFNNISVILWQSILLVEETREPGENHWPVTSHWQSLSHKVVSSTPRNTQEFELTTLVVLVIDTDCTGSCKSNYMYHTITTTTTPNLIIQIMKYNKICLPFIRVVPVFGFINY